MSLKCIFFSIKRYFFSFSFLFFGCPKSSKFKNVSRKKVDFAFSLSDNSARSYISATHLTAEVPPKFSNKSSFLQGGIPTLISHCDRYPLDHPTHSDLSSKRDLFLKFLKLKYSERGMLSEIGIA